MYIRNETIGEFEPVMTIKGDSVYESLVDMNVYTPAQYMENWRWVR